MGQDSENNCFTVTLAARPQKARVTNHQLILSEIQVRLGSEATEEDAQKAFKRFEHFGWELSDMSELNKISQAEWDIVLSDLSMSRPYG